MNLPDSTPTVLIPSLSAAPESSEPCRTAPTWLRLLAGTLDLGLEVLLAAGLVSLWLGATSPEIPPRYWNQLDYLVDLINTRPDLVLPPLWMFAAVFVVWEVLAGVLLGGAPVARLLGMRVCTNGGRRPGVARIFVRTVLALVLTLTAGLSPILAFLSPRRRMLHDILTGCHVLWGRPPEAWKRQSDLAAGVRGMAIGNRPPSPSGPRR